MAADRSRVTTTPSPAVTVVPERTGARSTKRATPGEPAVQETLTGSRTVESVEGETKRTDGSDTKTRPEHEVISRSRATAARLIRGPAPSRARGRTPRRRDRAGSDRVARRR